MALNMKDRILFPKVFIESGSMCMVKEVLQTVVIVRTTELFDKRQRDFKKKNETKKEFRENSNKNVRHFFNSREEAEVFINTCFLDNTICVSERHSLSVDKLEEFLLYGEERNSDKYGELVKEFFKDKLAIELGDIKKDFTDWCEFYMERRKNQ